MEHFSPSEIPIIESDEEESEVIIQTNDSPVEEIEQIVGQQIVDGYMSDVESDNDNEDGKLDNPQTISPHPAPPVTPIAQLCPDLTDGESNTIVNKSKIGKRIEKFKLWRKKKCDKSDKVGTICYLYIVCF